MISRQPALRVAILRNYDTPAQWGQDMVNSWKDIIETLKPGSDAQVYHPITTGEFPNAEEFDLIVLTGGVFNLTLPIVDPWVQQTLDFVRDTNNLEGGPKIAGICWGHQAICRAMGGEVGWNVQGDVVGVQTFKSTAEGTKFFGLRKTNTNGSPFPGVALHKFHKRCVSKKPPSFTLLAEDNEILLSSNNKIITFQGHPEMTNMVAKGILDADEGAYTGQATEEAVREMYNKFELPHDGVRLFERVIRWLDE